MAITEPEDTSTTVRDDVPRMNILLVLESSAYAIPPGSEKLPVSTVATGMGCPPALLVARYTTPKPAATKMTMTSANRSFLIARPHGAGTFEPSNENRAGKQGMITPCIGFIAPPPEHFIRTLSYR